MDWAEAARRAEEKERANLPDIDTLRREEDAYRKAEERSKWTDDDRKKEAKRKREEYNSESPTKEQRRKQKNLASAEYKKRQRAAQKAEEDSYKDKCKTAGLQYVPPARKEKAADRSRRLCEMDKQISARQQSKEKERLRKEAARLRSKLDLFCKYLSEGEMGPVGTDYRKMFFIGVDWDEDRCKEACTRLGGTTGGDLYLPPREDCEIDASELRRNGKGNVLMPNHPDYVATLYKSANRARRHLEMDYFCAMGVLHYLSEYFEWTREERNQREDDIMKAAQRKIRREFKFHLPEATVDFVPRPENETSEERHQRLLAMEEKMYNPVVVACNNDP